jgi:hypothetical protein
MIILDIFIIYIMWVKVAPEFSMQCIQYHAIKNSIFHFVLMYLSMLLHLHL